MEKKDCVSNLIEILNSNQDINDISFSQIAQLDE